MRYEVRQQIQRITQATESLKSGLKKLRLSDGTPRYSPKEEGRLKKELIDAANQAAEGVEDMIRKGYTEVGLIERKKHLPPFVKLAGEMASIELARANAMRAFVTDDVAKSPLPTLADRVLAVAAHGDRLLRTLYAEHLDYRLGEIRATQPRTVIDLDGATKTVVGNGDRKDDPQQVEGLREAHKVLQGVLELDDSYVKEANDLRDALADLSKAKTDLTFAIADADGRRDRIGQGYRNQF